MEQRRCPACGSLLEDAYGGLATTGEFSLGSPDLAKVGLAQPLAPQLPATAASRLCCSWCGRPASQVKKLISGPGVQICDGCVALCFEVLRAELPDFGPDFGS